MITHRICKTCKEPFYIKPKHLKWFQAKQLEPFTHCYKCRKERREVKNAR